MGAVSDDGSSSGSSAEGADLPGDTAEPSAGSTRRRGWWRPRLAVLFGGALLALAVAGGLWIAVTGLIARSDLRHAQSELPQLRVALLNGNLEEAQRLGSDIGNEAMSARSLLSGPAWWVGAHLPYVGGPLQTSRVLATAVDHTGNVVLPALVKVSETIADPNLRQGSTVNLGLLRQLLPVTDHAANVVRSARDTVTAVPEHTWLGAVDNARQSLETQLTEISGYLDGARRGLRTALPLLGEGRPQRIFIGFENEAEARGLGGLPAAFAIADADDGRVTFSHFGNDSELRDAKADIDLGSGYRRTFGQAEPTTTFRNSDMSPDFVSAARIWAAMWQQHSGQRIDSAIAVDPTALGYLLNATGPAVASDGTKITGQNVVALTQRTQYSRFTDRTVRQRWVLSIARAVSQRLVSGHAIRYVARAVAHAAAERRFLVWSADPAIERQLIAAGYAGTLNTPGAPLSAFTVTNASGSKLSYYLSRTTTYRRTGCGRRSTATASLILTNEAPRYGLPEYVTHRADTPPSDAQPGDDNVIVAYYYTQGAQVIGVDVNGEEYPTFSSTVAGNGVIQLDLELAIGVRNTVTILTAEPPATEPAAIVNQPLVRPMRVVSTGSVCGG